MNLKGDYSGLTSYSVGDVVRNADDVIYVLRKPATSGTPPTDSRYWERLAQPLADAVELIMDGVAVAKDGALTGKIADNLTTNSATKVLSAKQGKKLKDMLDVVNPDSKTLVLLSSTASSTKKFAITVDDDGELTATEVIEE